MTMDEFARKLQREARELNSATSKALREAAGKSTARIAVRVFDNGLNGNNISIGSYSTKDMLVGASNWAKQSARDAFFRSKPPFRTILTRGRRQPLAVLEGGYKRFRELNGRQSSRVDLSFTGNLQKDFGLFDAVNAEGGVEQGFKRTENVAKALGAFDKYGNVWAAGAVENERFLKEFNELVLKYVDF